METLWQQQHFHPRRVCDLPRLVLEPGRPGLVGESAFLRRNRQLQLHFQRLPAATPSGAPSFCSADGSVAQPALAMSDGFPGLPQPTDPASFSGNLQSQNLDFKIGRVQQYNFNIERLIPGDVVLTVGYAGSRSSHILVDGLNLNVSSPCL